MFKTFPKILTILFLVIFINLLASAIFILTVPETQAADVKFTPQVGIDQEFQKGVSKTIGQNTGTEMIAKYIRAIYKYAIGIVGILAAVVLMFGGVLWITAGGNQTRVGEAKSWIGASLTGLVIALTSYLILATVNPALVNFKITGVGTVEELKTPKTAQEIDTKCLTECKDISGLYDYDPKTNTCNCYGSGKHTECQVIYGTYGSREDKCVEVPYAGISTCADDNSCRQKYGCCRCLYGIGLGTSFYTTCTASVNMKSQQDCYNYCGIYIENRFVPSAFCDKNKNCVAQ